MTSQKINNVMWRFTRPNLKQCPKCRYQTPYEVCDIIYRGLVAAPDEKGDCCGYIPSWTYPFKKVTRAILKRR